MSRICLPGKVGKLINARLKILFQRMPIKRRESKDSFRQQVNYNHRAVQSATERKKDVLYTTIINNTYSAN